MESNYSYDVTEIASKDIFDVEEYIKISLKNEEASISLANEIKEKFEKASKFPMLNHDCKYYGIDDDHYRYVKVNNYNLYCYVNVNIKKITF